MSDIKAAIDQGHITTWAYDDDGDFTHTAKQYVNKAWLRPSIGASELKLSIISIEGTTATAEIRGIYLGRFAEMLIAHFESDISLIKIG